MDKHKRVAPAMNTSLTSATIAEVPRIDRAFVLDKCKSLIDFQLWPAEIEGRLEPWLNNFGADEIEFALYLLNSFVFLNERMIKQLFSAAFQDLSAINRAPRRPLIATKSSWQHFFDSLIVTYVTGETPRPVDSGHIFARMSRDILGISEGHIVSPEVALTTLVAGPSRPVLFVDDFVGSGQQFIRTWKRRYTTGGMTVVSFKEYAASRRAGQFFYCPAVCTASGAGEIAKECPEVLVSPGNLLGHQYSCLDPKSIIWPVERRAEGVTFLERASHRAGIPDTDGGEDDWRGFHKLALGVGFHHGIPDATLPIFTWNKNGWRPLVGHWT